MAFETQKQLLNTEETARLLGLKPRTLVLWRHEGRSELPFVRIGRAVRYRPADVEAFIAAKVCIQEGVD